MIQPEPLDQYADFGWARWLALVFVVWSAFAPLLVLWISGAVLLGLTPESQSPTQAQALWQVLPWLTVLAACGTAGVRLVRRRAALNVWLLGFGIMACMALFNSTFDETGRPFQRWPEATAIESLIRPAMAGVLVFLADMSAAARQRRLALRGE